MTSWPCQHPNISKSVRMDHGGNIVYIRWLSLVVVVGVLMSAKLEAQEAKPWWQFGASEKSELRSRTDASGAKANSGTASTGFNLPFSPSKSKPKTQSRKDSVFTRVGKTSKRWMDNTVDFINPFNDSDPTPAQADQSKSWDSSSQRKVENNGMGLGGFQVEKRPEDRSWFKR